jgi:hypothetical protein
MKLRTMAIATIFLALILSASPLGYCYSNIVAAKTTNDVSDYESMTRIGIAPGEEIVISGGAVLGTGVILGLGTGLATDYALEKLGLTLPQQVVTQVQRVWTSDEAMIEDLAYYHDGAGNMVATEDVTTLIPAVISSPYAITIPIAIVVVVVAILITATCVYIWWTFS